ncbi:MAG: DUF3795 domain-containing protein [Bacteroidales bacterium]|nr:DUF3795 domain-containing protein [Bacteroidales bacterium]
MKEKLKRREFLARSCRAGLAGCAVLMCGNTLAMSNFLLQDDKIPDPKKLNYCGYICPEKCEFLMATLADDEALKKECHESWGIKERYGKDFDPETAFCYGCKTEGKPEGVVVTECTVRSCVIEKELDCCIECKELSTCDKDLWIRYPDFHKSVKGLQQKYLEAKG